MKTTTIRVRVETKAMLDKLAQRKGDTYDDILSRLALRALNIVGEKK
jgi:predicted DNA-binding protein